MATPCISEIPARIPRTVPVVGYWYTDGTVTLYCAEVSRSVVTLCRNPGSPVYRTPRVHSFALYYRTVIPTQIVAGSNL